MQLQLHWSDEMQTPQACDTTQQARQELQPPDSLQRQKKITIESDWMTLKSSGRGSSRTSNAKSVKRFTSNKKAPNIQKDAYRLSLYN